MVGGQRVEDRAQHAALWDAGVQYDGGGHVREVLMPRSAHLEISLEGLMVLKAELKSMSSILTWSCYYPGGSGQLGDDRCEGNRMEVIEGLGHDIFLHWHNVLLS